MQPQACEVDSPRENPSTGVATQPPAPGAQHPNPTPVWRLDLGRLGYGAAYTLQRRLLEERDAGRVPDLLLLVEHPPVITLGRRGSRDDILVSQDELVRQGVAVFETNRGGLVTYHGPGQVVGYPIGKLRQLGGDAPTYVWRLEETIVRALARYGIAARRDAGNRGVFAGDGPLSGKIAAIGDLGVTSMERLLGQAPALAEAQAALVEEFGAVFERSVQPAPAELWRLIESWELASAPAPGSAR